MDPKKDSFRIRPSTSRPSERQLEEETEEELPSIERATGFPPEELASRTSLTFQWDCRQQSLQELGLQARQLRELNLSESYIESLRDLGTALVSLQVLYVRRCGLRELEGVSGFPALKELYAAFNCVQSLSPLLFADTLEVLDLELNEVTVVEELEALEGCPLLIALTLEGNPVTSLSDYRAHLFALLPALLLLDDCGPEDEEKPTARVLEQPPEKFTSPLYSKWGVTKDQLDEALQAEPDEDEVFKKALTTPKPGPSTVRRPKTTSSTRVRPSIFQLQPGREQAISVLTEAVFAGNPVRAAQHKRSKYFGEGGDILTLLQEFKVEETEELLSKEEEPRQRPQVLIRVSTRQTRKLPRPV